MIEPVSPVKVDPGGIGGVWPIVEAYVLQDDSRADGGGYGVLLYNIRDQFYITSLVGGTAKVFLRGEIEIMRNVWSPDRQQMPF
ncbi:hypothetical protein BJD55_gp155 [Gordonia phage Yvonnetastic]|uniref:Uncharacterized protein n=1 Tax=Gordonia phage Yvonnetastic TaxID=1821566 RepID=A0A142K928_9CAUD|nr:hypothetical protein BJD55_gp155 [Gordonia phage Yvonnetastic]AMS02611.1 hypothetical protein SEA_YVONNETASTIC_67 [Gordonia phage Yvonnetastic]WKW86043.1 hypothetical protein SEA_JONJAMES_69 [Gordonia Phage JonJames]